MQLLCTVRNCGAPLAREERRFVCANGHSFDIARSGYVNLLQPQDRKSRAPGDTAEAVAARRRTFAHAQPLVDALVRSLTSAVGSDPTLLVDGGMVDVGCGEGHYLEAFRRAYGREAFGIDISLPAIELAAKTYRDCTWIVANADRMIPFADSSVQVITSITARLNPSEFRRVLAPGGVLLVALPAPDDLVELREAVQGEGLERDRAERTIRDFAGGFTLVHRETLRHTAMLDSAAMVDFMSSSYRGLRHRERERLMRLDAMKVTMAREVLWFAKFIPREDGPQSIEGIPCYRTG
jgi:23S rRNA (guanine745-N1)-methyltransferase